MKIPVSNSGSATTCRKVLGKTAVLSLLLMVALSLTSCGLVAVDLFDGPDKLAATRKEKHFHGSACRHLLVLALFEDKSRRVAVENVFTDRLSEQGLPAVVGSIRFPDIAVLQDKAVLEDFIRRERIDHVITIGVKDVADNGGADWRRSFLSAPFPEMDLTGMTLAQGATKDVRFEMTIWDAKALKRDWTGSTIPFNRHDILRDLPEAADSTALSLIKGKILWPGKGNRN